MYITPLFFPSLLKIQRKSFVKFLSYGIRKEFFKNISIISLLKRKKILFYAKFYQLNLPNYTCNECILYSKTYSCELSMPVKFIQNDIVLGWVILNNIPLLTNKGHFILNGSPRIIMNQITRSPGVYYHKENRITKSKLKKKLLNIIYYADIISEKGNWLRLEIDNENIIWTKTKRIPKISALLFLQALGISSYTLINFFKYPIKYQYNNFSLLMSQISSLNQIYSVFKLEQLKNMSSSSTIWKKSKLNLFEKFMNPTCYDLGIIGRIRINKKLHTTIYTKNLTLNSNDLLLSIDYLLKIKYGLETVDDIDHLKNKRIKTSGELIQIQLNLGIIRLRKLIIEKISNKTKQWNLLNVITSTPIDSTLAEFFGLNPLSQFMDEINPLAIITHKRRISSLGFGGVNRDTATLTIRSIHPTLYGRICPIETPEGKNAGLVNSFSIFANINYEGLIETPFFQVYRGQVLYDMGINYLPVDHEDSLSIIPYDIKKSRLGFLPKTIIPTRFKQQLKEINFDKIDLISISRIQMISIATSLIPFLEHNDANRVLMGSNMQRQAVTLVKPECPLIGTGLESKIMFDLNEGIKSYSSGIINYVSAKKITIYNIINQYKNYDQFQSMINLPYFSFKDLQIISNVKNRFYLLINKSYDERKFSRKFIKSKINIKVKKYLPYFNFQKIRYLLKQNRSSNQGTYIIHRTNIFEGNYILRKEFVFNGFSGFRNELALGNNLFVGYISWKGYNFEDAIILSKMLVKNNIYTSTHIENYETEIKRTKNILEQITKHIKKSTFEQRHKLDEKGIIKPGFCVKQNDILVGKLLPIETKIISPYKKLLYEIIRKQFERYQDTSLRVPKNKKGRVISIEYIYILSNIINSIRIDTNYLQKVKINLMQNRIIQIGDKLSGRHGNKGVISKIMATYEMPYFIDGTSIDILLNPLGVPSRMNVGQVLEALLGLASCYLKRRFQIIPFDECFNFEASRNMLYSKLYLCNLKTGKNWLLNLNNPGKNKIIDAYSGLCFHQPLTIGKAYILKLIHLVEEKVHARSTGSYSLVTQQPLRGKSKLGGQRIGEMEVWALEGFGAAYTLHEILTIKSDDIKSRQKVVNSILSNESITFGTAETFKVLIRELQSLCLNIEFSKFTVAI